MTRYEICQTFVEIMGLPVDGIAPDKDGGKPGPDGTLRPYDCHLDTAELKNLEIDFGTLNFVALWRRWEHSDTEHQESTFSSTTYCPTGAGTIREMKSKQPRVYSPIAYVTASNKLASAILYLHLVTDGSPK